MGLEQLSGLDSAFLFLDGRHAPMHIGSVQLYAPPADGFDFKALAGVLAARLDEAPLLKRRVVQVPLRLGRPFWADDPHFSLDRHLARTALPSHSPGRRVGLPGRSPHPGGEGKQFGRHGTEAAGSGRSRGAPRRE